MHWALRFGELHKLVSEIVVLISLRSTPLEWPHPGLPGAQGAGFTTFTGGSFGFGDHRVALSPLSSVKSYSSLGSAVSPSLFLSLDRLRFLRRSDGFRILCKCL